MKLLVLAALVTQLATWDNWEMAISEATSFGRCRCTGEIDLKWVQVQFRNGAEILDSVPQGKCRECSARYYKATTLQLLEQVYRASDDKESP